jgi:hypothetical protein
MYDSWIYIIYNTQLCNEHNHQEMPVWLPQMAHGDIYLVTF